ncbi:MAG: hypothetical protein JXJ19_04070 [Elusimicrobia bacterium]|nr:hypothetical protein [Elusimicrobiota bacterium]
MQERKHIKGISAAFEGKVALVPLLGLSSDIKDVLAVSGGLTAVILLVSAAGCFFGRWFKKAELALVILCLSSLAGAVLTSFSRDHAAASLYFTVMVISMIYFLAEGTGDFSRRFSFRWGAGAAAGFFMMAVLTGLMKAAVTAIPGSGYFAVAIIMAAGKKIIGIYEEKNGLRGN